MLLPKSLPMTGQVYSSPARAAAMLWGPIFRPRCIVPVQVASDLGNENFVVTVTFLTSNLPQLKRGLWCFRLDWKELEPSPHLHKPWGVKQLHTRSSTLFFPIIEFGVHEANMIQTHCGGFCFNLVLLAESIWGRDCSHGLLWILRSFSSTVVMPSRRNPEAQLNDVKCSLTLGKLQVCPSLWLYHSVNPLIVVRVSIRHRALLEVEGEKGTI